MRSRVGMWRCVGMRRRVGMMDDRSNRPAHSRIRRIEFLFLPGRFDRQQLFR
jgi:hypothetical protein